MQIRILVHRSYVAACCISAVIAGGCSAENPAPVQAPGSATPQAASAAPGTTPSAAAVASTAVAPAAAPLPPGDVDLSKLPAPPDAKTVFANADVAMYSVGAAADATKETVRKLLVAQGWTPYGGAGDVQFFTRDLVRLSANVTAAPAEPGQTMIQYGKERISVNLPAPPEAETLQYADTTKTVFFETKLSRDDVVKFYRAELAKSQWEATTENAIEMKPKFMLIFRNPAKDLLTLEMQEVDGKTRTTLRHESAEQVAKSDAAFKKEMARREAERNKPLPQVTVAVPTAAKEIEQQKNRIEFQVADGTAKAVVDGWRKTYVAAGWTEKVITDDGKVGTIHFDKDNQSLSLGYTDLGIVPAEVSISAIGAELAIEKK